MKWDYRLQWRIQDFPDGGGGGCANPKVGAPTYYLATFSPKTAWKWKKVDPDGGGVRPWRPALDPPTVWFSC